MAQETPVSVQDNEPASLTGEISDDQNSEKKTTSGDRFQTSLTPLDESLFRFKNPADVSITEQRNMLSEEEFSERERVEYPDPKRVLYRSMILPGWGQVTNRQIWKVPVIYALFAGIGYYNYDLTRQYHGFRAAYYNATAENGNGRFGPTPDFVPSDMSSQQLRQIRDELRNQRDMTYVYLFLAYGLNILDAYVFAHMRSFDVSDDLSAQTTIGPDLNEYGTPGVKIRVSLNRR